MDSIMSDRGSMTWQNDVSPPVVAPLLFHELYQDCCLDSESGCDVPLPVPAAHKEATDTLQEDGTIADQPQ